jgi:preprotein translocase subunit SecF
MQIFTKAHIDFMGKKVYAVAFSGALLVIAIVAVVTLGFNLGLDFVGGTEIELKFVHHPDIASLRAALDKSLGEDVSLQRVGDPGANTVLIRAPQGGEEEGGTVSRRIVQALLPPAESAAEAAGKLDLNEAGAEDLEPLLGRCDAGLTPGAAKDLAAAIAQRRLAAGGALAGLDDLASVQGMTPEVKTCLANGTFTAPFGKWKDYFVGPKVGQELRDKALWAIGFSLVGILIYLTFRFQFEYGLGAVLALFHDVIITTGLLVLLHEEFDLTMVAALLTLAGYSVNDTIVVFDRIRENLRTMRSTGFEDVINASINQTLSRTVLTAGTVLMTVAVMLVAGGTAFHGFALCMLIGTVLGTYSSIFIASPIVVVWRRWFGAQRARRGARA